MSKIAITPNASGTGTINIVAPNTNTDRTLTIPDVTGNVVTTGDSGTVTMAMLATSGTLPALDGSALTNMAGSASFMIDMNGNQAISGTTWTKLEFDTEETDPDGVYNTTTYQFTAPADGNYFFHGRCNIDQYTNKDDTVYLRFYVNNNQPSVGDATESVQSGYSVGGGNNWFNVQTQGTLNLSANDTVDLRVYTTTGARNIRGGGSGFGGFRLS